MKRRTLIAALGGTGAVWPLKTSAQHTGQVPQVGFLYPGLAAMAVTRIAALRDGLRAFGHANADRVEILGRSSEGDPARLAALAADLVERKVDAIVAVSPAGVRTAKLATTVIPIVANDLESDPIAGGFVASLAHPGGNITGVFSDFPNFGMKWLELLKDCIPALSSVVVLRDVATSPVQLDAVQAAGRVLNVKLDVLDVTGITDLESAFKTAGERRPDAVIILASPLFGTDPGLIGHLALVHRLPTATLFSDIARTGGLLSYGPNLLGTFVQLGTMVGKVLKGARPADLPVERPTKFEMVVNLKTAKALGLIIPPSVIARADEVIE